MQNQWSGRKNQTILFFQMSRFSGALLTGVIFPQNMRRQLSYIDLHFLDHPFYTNEARIISWSTFQFSKSHTITWHYIILKASSKIQPTGAILEISLRVGVIPFNVTSGHVLLTTFVSFYSLRVQKPLQRALSEVFCTKLRFIHHVKLV